MLLRLPRGSDLLSEHDLEDVAALLQVELLDSFDDDFPLRSQFYAAE